MRNRLLEMVVIDQLAHFTGISAAETLLELLQLHLEQAVAVRLLPQHYYWNSSASLGRVPFRGVNPEARMP